MPVAWYDRHVLRERAALQLPLLAPAVQQLDVVEAAELQVSSRRRPRTSCCSRRRARRSCPVRRPRADRSSAKLGLADEVATDLRVQVGGPVPAHGAFDVALVVGGDVLVDLDDANGVVVEVLPPANRCRRAPPAWRSRSCACSFPPDAFAPGTRKRPRRRPLDGSGSGNLLRPRERWRLPEGATTHTAQAGRDHGSDEPAAARLDQIPTS